MDILSTTDRGKNGRGKTKGRAECPLFSRLSRPVTKDTLEVGRNWLFALNGNGGDVKRVAIGNENYSELA